MRRSIGRRHAGSCVVMALCSRETLTVWVVVLNVAHMRNKAGGSELVEQVEVLGPGVETHLIHGTGGAVGKDGHSPGLTASDAERHRMVSRLRVRRGHPPSV